MLEKARKAESLLAKLESGLLVALLTGMVTLAFAQVARRQLFGTGALWADTLLRHLVLWVGFLGASLAAADEKHFAWEAAANYKGRAGKIMRALAHLAAVVILVFLTKAAWAFFQEEHAAAKVLFSIGAVGVPEWLFALSIPAGFFLVLVHTLLRGLHGLLE